MKAKIYKLLPQSIRKLQMMENSKNDGGLDDAYRVFKETELLRLKLRITDFASAIIGVLHGWIMVTDQFMLEGEVISWNRGHSTLIKS